MEKTNKRRLRIILVLSVVIILLFGGILVNLSISNYITATAPTLPDTHTFLPSIATSKCYGSESDDSFVDAFFVGNDTYVFYNEEGGIMQRDGEGEPLKTSVEGRILKATLTPYGFAVAIQTDNHLSIKIIGFDGIPTTSCPITLKNAEIEFMSFDGSICIAVRHQGDFDYVLSYFKYDFALNEIYRRDIYSLYNLSSVAIYPMSNKTVIFFNAQYGSVKRGGYSVLHNTSLSMQTEYFSELENYTVCDAKPYKNGFIISALSNGKAYVIELNENMEQHTTKLEYTDISSASIYTDSNSCYIGIEKPDCVDLIDYTGKEVKAEFADKVFDCIFIDGCAVFAYAKNGTTYVTHQATGIVSPIVSIPPAKITLKKNGKLIIFATLSSSSLTGIGGVDIYKLTLS